MTKLMTTKECAEWLQIGMRTLRRYYQEQGLPYIMVGTQYRFKPEQVERWLEERSRNGVKH